MKHEHILQGYDKAVIIMAFRAPEYAPKELLSKIGKHLSQMREEQTKDAVAEFVTRHGRNDCGYRATSEFMPYDAIDFDSIPKTTAQELISHVAKKHKVSIGKLKSVDRSRHLVRARQEAMYYLSKKLELSLPTIGRMLGGRDHTTVLHGVRKFAELNNLPI